MAQPLKKETAIRGDRGVLGNLYLKYRVMTSGYMETRTENVVIDVILLTIVTTLAVSLVMLVRSGLTKILS